MLMAVPVVAKPFPVIIRTQVGEKSECLPGKYSEFRAHYNYLSSAWHGMACSIRVAIMILSCGYTYNEGT